MCCLVKWTAHLFAAWGLCCCRRDPDAWTHADGRRHYVVSSPVQASSQLVQQLLAACTEQVGSAGHLLHGSVCAPTTSANAECCTSASSACSIIHAALQPAAAVTTGFCSQQVGRDAAVDSTVGSKPSKSCWFLQLG